MNDVARLADVSLKTVSRVVNHESGVSPELTLRVQEAVRTLGYRPDDRARRLRQTAPQTGTIGFVMVDVANPFFSALLRGIEDVARARGCLVLAGSTDGSETREQQLVESLVDRRVDGLIVVSSGRTAETLSLEIDRGSPVVLLDLEPEEEVPMDLVRSDHFAGAAAAARHLLEHGHTDIAYMGDDIAKFSARSRLEGFRTTLAAAGVTIEEERITLGAHPSEEWRQIGLRVFSRPEPATAVFTAQNLVTIGVVRALHDLDMHRRVALVGFDDVEMAEALDPGITVVPQYPRELGRLAAERLFARVDGDVTPPVRQIIDHPLVARGSGEIAPR